MTRMLTSTTLPPVKPSTAHVLTWPSSRQRPHMLIFVTAVLVLLVLLEVASAKEEVVIRYDYDTLNNVRKDHAYEGDDVRFEVKASDVDGGLVIAASLGFECKLDVGAVEQPMTNQNGTYSWTKSCIKENFYYYIKPQEGELCKFGIVQVEEDGARSDDSDEFTRSHSKMKSPVEDKCEDGFVKKDGECYESNYKMVLIIVHSVLGGVIVGALVVWLLVWRRRRRSKMSIEEESATLKTSPATNACHDTPEVAPSTVAASAPTDITIVGLNGAASSHAPSELDEEPRLGQALNAPAGDADALSTEPSAPDISELVMKMDTGDPPTYEEATKPS